MTATRRPPYASTVIALATVLSLLGIYGILIAQARAYLSSFTEHPAVVVELLPSTDAALRAPLESAIVGKPYVEPGSLTYVPREEGLELLESELGADVTAEAFDNPLLDIYTLRLAGTPDDEGAGDVIADLQTLDGVAAAYVQETLPSAIARRLDAFTWAGVVAGVLLLLGVAYLVLSTTTLALLSQQQLIRNMELVGARWSFIARPFLRRAAVNGMVAGLLATLVAVGVERLLDRSLAATWQALTPTAYAALALALVAVGVVLTFGGTYFTIRRTLRLRVDDLSAYA